MIQERIAEVRVHVRTDIPDVTYIRPAAERIVRAALDRCALLLEERAPGRVVLIRRLPLRWRLDEAGLDDATQVEELARAAADAIERTLGRPVLDPPAGEDGAVVFDDEAHLRASHLLALARGGPAWFHAAVEDPAAADPLAILAAPNRRATAQATLMRLARENVLAEALAARPAPAVAVFAAALGCDLEPAEPAYRDAADPETPTRPAYRSAGDPGTPTQPAHRSAADPKADAHGIGADADGMVAELASLASHWPPLEPAARRLALRVHAAAMLDVELAAPAAIALAKAAIKDRPGARSPRTPAVEPAGSPFPQPAAPAYGVAADGRTPVDRSPQLAAAAAGPEESAELISIRCGGLFYLCQRLLELDLAEALWKACLPEGAVLAAAASALLGPAFAGDAASAFFGGVDAAAACPEVTPEQHAEVVSATCAALAAALPRRGLADIPPVNVTLADHRAGRLLVAAAQNSPFAFFAWPAATPGMLSGGLRALLDTWPHRGTLAASPALATLDSSGRLRPARGLEPQRLLLPEAPSPFAAALLAVVAGAPSLLFAARAGSESATVEAFVARYIARRARIRRTTAARMDVIFGPGDIDLDVRRAGLDRDPGWLPWLRRTVHFVFEERELAAGGPT
jgi:hypothetical protein